MILFSDLLWHKTTPLYQLIVEHPFNQELAKGTLSSNRFQFYMWQDALYLIEYAKALALIAGRSDSQEDRALLYTFSEGALIAERQLHAQFIDLSLCSTRAPAPTLLSYTAHLLQAATLLSWQEAIASVLPCFWIYREVGNHTAAISQPDNPYHPWIATYSCQEFAAATDKMIALLNRAAASNPAIQPKMEAAFTTSALYEWRFWDDAYHMRVDEH